MKCKADKECLCADCRNNDGKRCMASGERTCSRCNDKEQTRWYICSTHEPPSDDTTLIGVDLAKGESFNL